MKRFGTRAHAIVYRLSGGRILGRMGGQSVLMLQTVGRRTGQTRTTPVQYLPSDGAFVVVAASAGATSPPAWYLNLCAAPQAAVRIGAKDIDVQAREIHDSERDAMWRELTLPTAISNASRAKPGACFQCSYSLPPSLRRRSPGRRARRGTPQSRGLASVTAGMRDGDGMAPTRSSRTTSLEEEHTPRAVSARLLNEPSPSYLHDFIYGAVDGAITTFAVVAGVAGANLDETVVIILGGANLIADGFSMAVSNFLGSRAERQRRELARSKEQLHIRLVPEGEREEIRQIFATKGFEGNELERVVEVITSEPELWANTMMSEELGFGSTEANEYRAAFATLVAFLTVGFLPLMVFVYDLATPGHIDNAFTWSAVMTGVAFLAVGSMKSRFVAQAWWRSALETLAVGGLAAALAYAAGALLQSVA